MKSFIVGVLFWAGLCQAAEPVKITILHTNDLHSHYRPERTPLGLGGIARLKTLVTKIREENPNTLLVDGGDWSEGGIYFTEGAGRENLKMMDHLGYDVAVIGNHEWLNGPDVLLQAIREANPRMSLIAANVGLKNYSNAEEFRRLIPRAVIRNVGGIRIAFIGLLTQEAIYDKFLKPVQITDPVQATKSAIAELRGQADLLIGISHNSRAANFKYLQQLPELDLIIGGHDHAKLTQPMKVIRPGARTAWIVEAGAHGKYLGRVDLQIGPKGIDRNYQLLQIDSSLSENPETLSSLDALEGAIEKRMGPIFHDEIGSSEVELPASGVESRLGNLIADSYRAVTHADIGMDHQLLLNGELHAGPLRSADVFNALPSAFDPRSGKSWTIQTVSMHGWILKQLLALLYSTKLITENAPLCVSGIQLVYDPLLLSFAPGGPGTGAFLNSVENILIDGEPLRPTRLYSLAISEGLKESLLFLKDLLNGALPVGEFRDTGLEQWRVLLDRIKQSTPLTDVTAPIGGRVRSRAPDLGILADDLQWSTSGRVKLTIRNYGATRSRPGTTVELLTNENNAKTHLDPIFQPAAEALAVPPLDPGDTVTLVWEKIRVKGHPRLFELTARLRGSGSETNTINDQITRWFELPITQASPDWRSTPKSTGAADIF